MIDKSKIHSFYVDRLMRFMTPAQQSVWNVTLRKTFGYSKYADAISESQYAYWSGLSRNTAGHALDELIEFGILILVAHNDPALNHGNTYALQMDETLMRIDLLEAQKAVKVAAIGKKMSITRSKRRDDPRLSHNPTPPVVRQPHPPGCGTSTHSETISTETIRRTSGAANSSNSPAPDANHSSIKTPKTGAQKGGDSPRLKQSPIHADVPAAKKSGRAPADPQTQYPAVQAYLKITGLKLNPKRLRQITPRLIAAMGNYPDFERADLCYRTWVDEKGYSPMSLTPFEEWYITGIPPHAQGPAEYRNTNGKVHGSNGRVPVEHDDSPEYKSEAEHAAEQVLLDIQKRRAKRAAKPPATTGKE